MGTSRPWPPPGPRNEGPTPNCLKPFLIPDMWFESDKVNQDKNSNNYMEPDATANGNGNGQDGGEQWYLPALPTRRLLRAVRPNRDESRRAADRLREQTRPRVCRGRGAADPPQAADREQRPAAGKLRTSPSTVTEQNLQRGDQDRLHRCQRSATRPNRSQGSTTGQVQAGHRIPDQPGSRAPPGTRRRKQVENSAYSDWTQSPRVIIVGLMDPIYMARELSTNVKPDAGSTFTQLRADSSCETTPGNTDNLKALFLGLAPGRRRWPRLRGSLVRRLQLIE